MNGLFAELKNKNVHIRFVGAYYANGGTAAADYRVRDCVDGFLELMDERGRTVFCKLDQIKQITVLSGYGGGR